MTESTAETAPGFHRNGQLRYLSDQWLAAADEALSDISPLPSSLSIEVTVTDGPDGERRYRLILGAERVGIEAATQAGTEAGADDATTVRMTLAWPVAVAIATGGSSAQRAFLDGHIQFGGDASLLLGHQDRLSAVDDRLGLLRDRTDFGQT